MWRKREIVKMMTKNEALKLALEALHGFIPYLPLNNEAQCGRYDEALTAIKEALAQPEQDGKCKYCANGCPACDARKLPKQEPVAWIYKGEKSFDGNKWSDEYELTASKQVALWKDKDAKPLYTTTAQHKPLTDKELNLMGAPWLFNLLEAKDKADLFAFIRTIETRYGIKE